LDDMIETSLDIEIILKVKKWI